jgi:superfamily II DNA or RNA helicase
LVDGFNKSEFDSLVAIRCLDEGINIPSIKGALILASNDDYREFVQRRGRILRLYDNKDNANIYDVIVLPSLNNADFAAIELRRFYEYAKLAINKDENMNRLNDLMEDYGIDFEALNAFTEVEDDIDE